MLTRRPFGNLGADLKRTDLKRLTKPGRNADFLLCSDSLLEVVPQTIVNLGRQDVGNGMVVDGFARFQALNVGISGAEISEEFCF